MNELTIFNYEDNEVRTIIGENGEPWWIAKDVCAILGLKDVSRALIEIDQDEKSETTINRDGNNISKLRIINEAGLYHLIFKSIKPEAKKFKRWVAHEVLPSIRKTGSYSMAIPKTYGEALLEAGRLAVENDKLQIENAAMLPKADFFDAVAESKDAIEMSKVAKILDAGIGRNLLFKLLRDMGILRKNNEPYQEYVDRGYFRVIEQKFIKANGEITINIKTLVYQKGLEFIRKKLQGDD